MLQNNWEDSFDNRFVDCSLSLCYEHEQMQCEKCRIKSFISQLLKEERAKLLEEIEKKVNLINVSGGGSGRMLKLQLLDYLNSMK